MQCDEKKCKSDSGPRVIINITVVTDKAVGKDSSTYADFTKEDEE